MRIHEHVSHHGMTEDQFSEAWDSVLLDARMGDRPAVAYMENAKRVLDRVKASQR